MLELPKTGHDSPGAAAVRGRERAVAPESGWPAYMLRIQKGEESALAALYDESAPLIYGLALRMLRNAADAEEATADVFSHVWRCAHTWDSGRGAVATWLIMLCRSRCIDRIRSRRTRRQTEQAIESPSIIDSRVEWQDRETISAALRQLDPEDRRLIELAFFDGLTHTELAKRLSLPLGTVKTRIRSAVQQMRNLLKGSGT